MLNTAIVIGVSREIFECELKSLTQKNLKNSEFDCPQEAYESALDYFFINHEDAHRSDSNHNSCIVIKKIEEKNKLALDEIRFTNSDFQKFLLDCNNIGKNTNWFSQIISEAFKNLAQKIKFTDVRIFVMNYS